MAQTAGQHKRSRFSLSLLRESFVAAELTRHFHMLPTQLDQNQLDRHPSRDIVHSFSQFTLDVFR